MPDPLRLESLVRMTDSLERALAGEPVYVGTENVAKCGAVRSALQRLQSCLPAPTPQNATPKILIRSQRVDSSVSEQPIGFAEITEGARNRARAALALGDGVLSFGIEDGLVPFSNGIDGETFFNVGCAWVTDGETEGSGFSSGFAYPPGACEPAVRDQRPIGDLFDALWRRERDPDDRVSSGRSEGNIGKLTAGRLTRSDYGSQAVLCALVRFLHRDLYD